MSSMFVFLQILGSWQNTHCRVLHLLHTCIKGRGLVTCHESFPKDWNVGHVCIFFLWSESAAEKLEPHRELSSLPLANGGTSIHRNGRRWLCPNMFTRNSQSLPLSAGGTYTGVWSRAVVLRQCGRHHLLQPVSLSATTSTHQCSTRHHLPSTVHPPAPNMLTFKSPNHIWAIHSSYNVHST